MHGSRKLTVGKNLKRLIKENPDIRTMTKFAEIHGCDIRTVKTWVKHGIDRLTTISEVAMTLGVCDLELIFDNTEPRE
jgi:hypothetical protein